MTSKNNKEKIQGRINFANRLSDNFKRRESLTEFLILQREFPENTDVLFAFAIIQNSSQQQASAIETLKRILDIDPNHQDTLNVLPTVTYEYAIRLLETGEAKSAKEYLLDFISLKNDNKIDLANGYKELAEIEKSFGEKDEAKRYIDVAMDILNNFKEAKEKTGYKALYNQISERINGS